MTDLDPKILIGIGLPLLILGFVLPLLMVMQIIPSTFFLNFFSYGASLLGIILGMLGAMSIIARGRNRRR
jgi:hypothetical protein